MKKLTLSKETLRALDEGQLSQVAGGVLPSATCFTLCWWKFCWTETYICPTEIRND